MNQPPSLPERIHSARNHDVTVTIYGSYSPGAEKQFLIEQGDFLRSRGYAKTNLVDDYPGPSDINFLIFTKNGKNQGVTREFFHIVESPSMFFKIQFCTVFDQIGDGKDEISSMSPLLVEDIENSGLTRREFSSTKELQDALIQQTYEKIKLLNKRRFELRRG